MSSFDPHRSPFVGRAADLARIRDSFAGGARLVTTVGAPGVGKSRLALQFAEAQAAETGWSTFFVALSDVRDAIELRYALAIALDFDTVTVDSIGYSIGDRGDCLIVLDGFEHLEAAAARTVEGWTRDAARARFLVTSRQALGRPGEHVIDLGPLALPDPGASCADDVRAAAAGALFEVAAPGYTMTDDDAPVVAHLVRQLGGVPMAIQLAASRTQVMSPADIADRLDRGQDVLASLRGSVGRSWALLSETERRVLAQCSVFVGEFGLDAASAVVELPRNRRDSLLDALQGVIDKSLVRPSRIGGSGAVRFAVDGSVREYARQRLDELGMGNRARAQFAAHYRALLSDLADRTAAASDLRTSQQLELELANVLGAFAGDSERDISALERVALTRADAGSFHYLRDVAALVSAGDDARRDAALTAMIAAVYGLFGRGGAAQTHAQRAIRIAAEGRDAVARAFALIGLGQQHVAAGQWEAARDALDEARLTGERDAAPAVEVAAAVELAQVHLGRDMTDHAIAVFEDAAKRGVGADDRRLAGRLWAAEGAARHEARDAGGARGCFERAERAFAEVGDAVGLGETLARLAAVHHETGDLAAALAVYERAAPLLHEAGARRAEGAVQSRLAAVRAALDDVDGATAAHDAAIAIARDVGDPGLFRAVAMLGASVELARCRAAARGGDAPAAAAHRHRAVRAFEEPEPGIPSRQFGGRGVDVRIAHRIARNDIAAGAYLIARDGQWFQRPDGERVELSQSKRLKTLLGLLVELHLVSPASSLSVDDLVARAWPGERMDAQSGANRVHVALSTLRSMGLRELLQRTDAGYRLDDSGALLVV